MLTQSSHIGFVRNYRNSVNTFVLIELSGSLISLKLYVLNQNQLLQQVFDQRIRQWLIYFSQNLFTLITITLVHLSEYIQVLIIKMKILSAKFKSFATLNFADADQIVEKFRSSLQRGSDALKFPPARTRLKSAAYIGPTISFSMILRYEKEIE